MAEIASAEYSVIRACGLSGCGNFKTGAAHKLDLSVLNATCSGSPHDHKLVSFNRVYNRWAIAAKLLMKWQ